MEAVNNGRTVVFIDSGHLRILLNRVGLGGKICMLKLATKLAKQGEFLHAFYYDCLVPGQNEHFLERVSRLPGITVKLGKLNNYQVGRVEKEVDVQLAIDVADVVGRMGRVQTVVLLTADADFIPVVNHCQNRGVRVIIAHAPAHMYKNLGISDRLIHAADAEIVLDREFLLDTVRDNVTPDAEPAGARIELAHTPLPTRTIGAGDEVFVEADQIVEVLKHGSATVGDGGIAIARSEANIHAYKGATIYLCADDVNLTGTSGFRLIRST